MKLSFLSFFLFLGFLTISCKKKGDNQPPGISKFSTDKSSYVEDDTLYIQAAVSDNEGLKSVAVFLSVIKDGEKLIVGDDNASVAGQNTAVNFKIPLNFADLVSGKYQLELHVSDGENTTKSFLEINIAAKVRVYSGSFLPVANGSGSAVHLLDINGDQIYKEFNISNLKGGVIANEMVILNANEGILSCYSIDSKSLKWANVVAIGADKLVSDYKYDPYTKLHYISLSGGYIRAVSPGGSASMTSQKIPDGYSPVFFGVNKSYLLVYSEKASSSQPRLDAYHATSGTFSFSFAAPDKASALCYLHKNKFALFTITSSGEHRVTVYDAELHQQPTQNLNAGYSGFSKAQAIDDQHIICQTDQGIVKVNVNTGQVSLLAPYSPVLAVQKDRGEFLYWQDGMLKRSNLNGGVLSSPAFGSVPKEIWPYYQ